MLLLFSVWKVSSVLSPAYLNNSSLILNIVAKREVWKLRRLNADCHTNVSCLMTECTSRWDTDIPGPFPSEKEGIQKKG